MRPITDRIADLAPEPSESLPVPAPTVREHPAATDDAEDDDDFHAAFAAW